MDADDVTQEVLIRTWKNIDKFEFDSAKSWMMKTTHNLCLDYLRKRKIFSQKEYSADEDMEETIPAPANLSDPEIYTRREILKARIHEAINNLPETLKTVFVMYELQGLRYKDISRTTNIPINSVKVYLLRARKKLQLDLRVFMHEEINLYE
jgi:RNA polymerase sigma-70 factor (ECF subfamily)